MLESGLVNLSVLRGLELISGEKARAVFGIPQRELPVNYVELDSITQ